MFFHKSDDEKKGDEAEAAQRGDVSALVADWLAPRR